MNGFAERNPNLKVFNAIMHLDEEHHICILIMYRFRLEISGVIHQSIPKRSVEGTGICRGGAV